MSRTVEILFKADGTVKIDAIGFSGRACEKATAEIEAMLAEGAKQQKKPEYHSSAEIGQQQSIG